METRAALSIASLETIPIRVPLVRPFRGSHYHMTHRSTIVMRINTDDGIAGEAYAGDEDASLLEIDRTVNDELVPKLVGEDAFALATRCRCPPESSRGLRARSSPIPSSSATSRTRPCVAPRHALHPEREAHVVRDRHVRVQGVVLEDHRDVTRFVGIRASRAKIA